jgi:glycosyltransferase involved in cell wall biosynthesis
VQDLRISLITLTFNAERTVARCIQSVINQSFKNIEYIVIDGKSTDNTVQIIHNFNNSIHRLVSEPDKGIYDGMNKGISLATGDVVGMLNADDFFADNDVLDRVAKAFEDKAVQLLYGDLDFVNASGKIFRKWRSGNYKQGAFNFGWMPPHPTFYCRRELFKTYGDYRLDLGTSADYELMLRLMHKNQINAQYLKKVMIKMEIGGASNKSLSNRLKALLFDLKAMRENGIKYPLLTLFLKPTRKISQFFK